MINFILENWYLLVVAFVVLILMIIGAYNFIMSSKEEQITKIKQWLLAAVTAAEAELGAKTGQIKLSAVYDAFLEAFPKLRVFISVDRFKVLVDEVLEQMRHLIATNEAVQKLVENTD